MIAKSERILAQETRALLAGKTDGYELQAEANLERLCDALELYVPGLVYQFCEDWSYTESLDGVFASRCWKAGHSKMALIGLCILMESQRVTPIKVTWSIAQEIDKVSTIQVQLGEKHEETGEIVTAPYNWDQNQEQLPSLPDRLKTLNWVYQLEFDWSRSDA